MTALALLIVAGCATRPAAPTTPPAEAPAKHSIMAGDKAPSFDLPRIDGRGSIVVPTGRPTLVMLWGFHWGGQRAMSGLQRLHERWAPKGLDVVAVSHDEPWDELVKVAVDHGVTYPIAWDTSHRVVERYGPGHVMSIYLVDRAGVVRFTRATGKESDPTADPSVEEAIASLLAQPAR